MYNLFLKEVTNLEICLYHTLLLKMLGMLDVHELVQHHNALSTILPCDQLPHDWEAFPYVVSSHHSADCRMYLHKTEGAR